MKKIFLVDDDAVVRTLYHRKLVQGGFEVLLAEDGLQAIQLLTTFTPDLILLDLMMPRLAGDSVLRFVRSHPKLANLPVIILTNAFMSEPARAISGLRVERALIKAECTPEKMLGIVGQILGVAVPPAAATSGSKPPLLKEDLSPARDHFLQNARARIDELCQLCQEFQAGPDSAARSGNLAELYKKIHHLAGAAGSAECHHFALLGGALEALLFELVEKPQFVNPSTARTVVAAVDYLVRLFAEAQSGRWAGTLTGEVLIVDDDPFANRIALAAVRRAKLTGSATENPLTALDWLSKKNFDLFLLDVEMPQLDGYDLCRKIRCLPGYEQTPVIYVTAHGKFESRAKSILAGGNDLIAKPIFPMELAVKAVTHLIRSRLAASAPV